MPADKQSIVNSVHAPTKHIQKIWVPEKLHRKGRGRYVWAIHEWLQSQHESPCPSSSSSSPHTPKPKNPPEPSFKIVPPYSNAHLSSSAHPHSLKDEGSIAESARIPCVLMQMRRWVLCAQHDGMLMKEF